MHYHKIAHHTQKNFACMMLASTIQISNNNPTNTINPNQGIKQREDQKKPTTENSTPPELDPSGPNSVPRPNPTQQSTHVPRPHPKEHSQY